MIDWNTLVLGPLNAVFGEPAQYAQLTTGVLGVPFGITVVFDEAYLPAELGGEPTAISARPVVGVRLSELPIGYAPAKAQGDTVLIQRTGELFVVKSGKTDGHGHARLELQVTT